MSDNSLTPLIDYVGNKTRLQFSGNCLKKPKLQYTHGAIVNIYIVYELGASGSNNSDRTLKNCLFSAVTLNNIKILTNIDILVMEVDLIGGQAFHLLVVDLVKMC